MMMQINPIKVVSRLCAIEKIKNGEFSAVAQQFKGGVYDGRWYVGEVQTQEQEYPTQPAIDIWEQSATSTYDDTDGGGTIYINDIDDAPNNEDRSYRTVKSLFNFKGVVGTGNWESNHSAWSSQGQPTDEFWENLLMDQEISMNNLSLISVNWQVPARDKTTVGWVKVKTYWRIIGLIRPVNGGMPYYGEVSPSFDFWELKFLFVDLLPCLGRVDGQPYQFNDQESAQKWIDHNLFMDEKTKPLDGKDAIKKRISLQKYINRVGASLNRVRINTKINEAVRIRLVKALMEERDEALRRVSYIERGLP